jgi:hypothetical protein
MDDDFEMKGEYDFKHAIRNPYARLDRNGPLVRLDPDVLKVFPDSEAVNKALRMLIETSERAAELAKAS